MASAVQAELILSCGMQHVGVALLFKENSAVWEIRPFSRDVSLLVCVRSSEGLLGCPLHCGALITA